MRLQVSTVVSGLNLMSRHLKNAPPIDAQRAADWMMIFEPDMTDALFASTAAKAVATLTFFPTPGEFAAVIEQGLEDRAELAWQYVRRAVQRANVFRLRPEDVGGDSCALWAAAAVGKPALECLFHIVRPQNHEVFTRAAFVKNYKIAVRFGLTMDEFRGERPALPENSPALPFIRATRAPAIEASAAEPEEEDPVLDVI